VVNQASQLCPAALGDDASLDRDHELQHVNPIPAASRVGPLLLSSVIAPRDPTVVDLPMTSARS